MIPEHLEPDWAARLVGTPYDKDGDDPEKMLGCRQMARWIYARVGLVLPPDTMAWRRHFDAVGRGADIERYDLLCFAGPDGITDHIGVALSTIEFIHAFGLAGQVVREPISRWRSRLVEVFRPKKLAEQE